MSEPAVRLQNVVRRFGALTAVDQVSFEVQRGEVFGLLGHNGAGKTTLLRLINGLLEPHHGDIRTLGLDPVVSGDTVRRRTGVLTEYPALDQFLSPIENLVVYGSIHGLTQDAALGRANALLDQLDFSSQRTVPSHALSAGLKQRVALARALVHEPELILLDEPTSNLDPLAARTVRDLVHRLSRVEGRTVLLSTHNLAEAQQLCDRVAIVRHGRLLAVGDLRQLGEGVASGTVEFVVDKEDEDKAAAVLAQSTGTPATDLAEPGAIQVRVSPSATPALVESLVAAGVRVHAVRPDQPTLEDVYVALHDGVQAPAEVDA